MSAQSWFWIIYVLAAIFGGYLGYRSENRYYFGGSLVVFILIGLLGWIVAGSPLK